MNPTTSINQRTQPGKQHFADRLPKLGVHGAPGSPRQAQGCPGESPGRAPEELQQRVPSRGRKGPGSSRSQKLRVCERECNRKAALWRQVPKTRILGLQEPKKAQEAPGARNAQFAKENVIEKPYFGDRLQKLGFWCPDLAPKEHQEITCHFGDPLWNSGGIDTQKH